MSSHQSGGTATIDAPAPLRTGSITHIPREPHLSNRDAPGPPIGLCGIVGHGAKARGRRPGELGPTCVVCADLWQNRRS